MFFFKLVIIRIREAEEEIAKIDSELEIHEVYCTRGCSGRSTDVGGERFRCPLHTKGRPTTPAFYTA